MGAAVSVHNSNLPPHLKELIQVNDELKKEIATKDAQFLNEQSMSEWKDHEAIIAILSERSKYQLHHIAEVYQRPKAKGGYGCYLETKLKSMLGGPYGEFLRDCVMKSDAIDAEYMHVTLSTLGCEENILAEVICASSTHELLAAKKYYEAVLKKPLADKIKSKTTNGSPFQKLLLAILTNSRAVGFSANEADAEAHAKVLYDAGLSDKAIERNDDAIFAFLAVQSREQCQFISAAYEKLYQKDIVEAVLAKYRGPVAFALMLWTAALEDSICKRLQVNITDPHVKVIGLDLKHLSHLFAKYPHRQMSNVLKNYEELFEVDLVKLVEEKFSGNYRKAVLGWLKNNTCDGGKEEHIAEILDSFENIDDLLKDEEKLKLVETLLEEENANLKAYSEAHHIHQDRSATDKGRPIAHDKALDKEHANYAKDFAVMKKYLKERFTVEDEDDSGYLDSLEFEHVLTHMDIKFTPDEIANIFKHLDADSSGDLSYDECLVELADCCINAIHNRMAGQSVKDTVDALMVKHQAAYDKHAAELNDSHAVEVKSDLTPSLEGYLHDAYIMADADKSGQLDPQEFFNVLHTVFNMTDGDKEFLNANWDDDGDGLISWTEALDEFSKIFKRLRDAKTDYWIALCDKNSGRFFWFNVSDEHSFWMNDEDEQNYQALMAEGVNRTEVIKPKNVPKKEIGKRTVDGKLTAREIRFLQKQKLREGKV